jgi:glycosyltransferase involved in cell wall biosynthesis
VGRRLVVVMPAYNAESTLERTWRDVPRDAVDEIILVDDGSSDHTVDIARRLGITVIEHAHNRGYGENQKTCYRAALERACDVVAMVHPDYQYDATRMAG